LSLTLFFFIFKLKFFPTLFVERKSIYLTIPNNQAIANLGDTMQTKHKAALASALIVIIALTIFFAGNQFQGQENSPVKTDVLFQVAAFNTFSLGNYGGVLSYG
jgi:hypothetical protein